MMNTTVKPEVARTAQENACWNRYHKEKAREEARAKKQMERMYAEHDSEQRVTELAGMIYDYQKEANPIEDRKDQSRKRREIKAAKKKATTKARAGYDTQIQEAQKKGEVVSPEVRKKIKSLDKRGAKFAKA